MFQSIYCALLCFRHAVYTQFSMSLCHWRAVHSKGIFPPFLRHVNLKVVWKLHHVQCLCLMLNHTSILFPQIHTDTVQWICSTHPPSFSSSTHRGHACVSWRDSAVLLFTQDRSQPHLMTVTFLHEGLADKTRLRIATNKAVLSPAP